MKPRIIVRYHGGEIDVIEGLIVLIVVVIHSSVQPGPVTKKREFVTHFVVRQRLSGERYAVTSRQRPSWHSIKAGPFGAPCNLRIEHYVVRCLPVNLNLTAKSAFILPRLGTNGARREVG